MSYCRWSSMDYTCDVYAYGSQFGYEIHLARGRRMGPQPYNPSYEFYSGNMSMDEFMPLYEIWNDSIKNSPVVHMDLPFENESFTLGDIEDFYDKLIELREVGYNFPDHVLDEVREEMEEERE